MDGRYRAADPVFSSDGTEGVRGSAAFLLLCFGNGIKTAKVPFPVNGRAMRRQPSENKLSAGIGRPIWLPVRPGTCSRRHSHIVLLDWTRPNSSALTISNLTRKSQGHLCNSIDISFMSIEYRQQKSRSRLSSHPPSFLFASQADHDVKRRMRQSCRRTLWPN